jgi:hypothetical protein
MNTIVWGRNITLEEDDVVYEKVSQFEDDEEGLGRLILTNPDEIKSLVASIDHNMKKRSFTNNNNTTVNLPKQQEEGHLDVNLPLQLLPPTPSTSVRPMLSSKPAISSNSSARSIAFQICLSRSMPITRALKRSPATPNSTLGQSIFSCLYISSVRRLRRG